MQGKTKRRILLAVLASILIGLVVLFRLITSGLEYNYMVSAYGTYFNVIVGRAIIRERYGDLMVLTEQDYHDPTAQKPPEWEEAFQVMATFFDSGRKFDCDVDIHLSFVDPKEFWPTTGTMLSYKPFHYVAIFRGPVPDIEPFLDRDRNAKLIGPLTSLRLGPESDDLQRYFEAIQSHHPAGIRWKLTECEGFSYFEFWESQDE